MLPAAVPVSRISAPLEDRAEVTPLGSWLSMAPLVAGVPGASHGIGCVLGAVFDIPHGYTSCIMLPSVMDLPDFFCFSILHSKSDCAECSDGHQCGRPAAMTCRLPPRVASFGGLE